MEKGKVIAVREGGDTLVYDYTDKDGLQWGHVERNAETFPVTPVLSIIARGYWEEPEEYEEYEEKRQVRDADFWGAPVGTPLPLPPGFRRPSAPRTPPITVVPDKPITVQWAGPAADPGQVTMSEPDRAAPNFTVERIGGQAFLKYGDMDFEMLGETDFYEQNAIDGAISDWGTWEGNYAMRVVAANIIGLDIEPSAGKEQLDDFVSNIIDNGISEGAPDWAKAEAERYIQQAYMLVGSIGTKSREYERELHRGMSVPGNSPVLKMKEGDSFDLTLSAFTPFERMAMQFTDSPTGWVAYPHQRVIFTLEKGAYTTRSTAPDLEDEDKIGNDWVTATVEEVTQGSFSVTKVKKAKIAGVTVTRIFIRQDDVWEIY